MREVKYVESFEDLKAAMAEEPSLKLVVRDSGLTLFNHAGYVLCPTLGHRPDDLLAWCLQQQLGPHAEVDQ
tara:strand:- start:1659 stop:1871 length:213 start_codon:yes stop_codon:yes gene_type:complete